MHWVFFALLTAAALSSADALTKRVLKTSGDLTVMWVREGYALPFLAIAFFFIEIPPLDSTFLLTVLALLPLEILALYLYVRAIRVSPLSLTVPFMALSPAFIVITAFVFLGEWPSPAGLAGVLLIAAGAYLLNASASKEGLLAPIRAIAREEGSVLMIVVALLYSVTSTLGKVAVQHSSPVFFGFFYPFTLTAVMTAILLRKGALRTVVSRPAAFAPIGVLTAVMIMAHFIGISLTNVAYMISVKRLSLVFSVMYGRFIFREVNIRERLVGAVVMLAGVALIVLF